MSINVEIGNKEDKQTEILEELLIEIKKINKQLELITGNEIEE